MYVHHSVNSYYDNILNIAISFPPLEYIITGSVMGKIMTSQRRSCPNPSNLWICYLDRKRDTAGKEVILDYLGGLI